jgi:hypothetical protein
LLLILGSHYHWNQGAGVKTTVYYIEYRVRRLREKGGFDDFPIDSPLCNAASKSSFLVAHHVGCDGRRLSAGRLGSHEGTLFLSSRGSNSLKTDWQKHVLASTGYLELGMFDEAAQVLEEIEPEEKTRNEVLGARVNLYMVAKKWDMAAAVASHLVKGRSRKRRLVDQSRLCTCT